MVGQFTVVALFFAMRNCEYLETSATKHKKRTEIILFQNIRFFSRDNLVPRSSPNLLKADTVSVDFEFQKNNEKIDFVTMYRSIINGYIYI